MSELVLLLIRIGLLVLLWAFVLIAVRVMRTDLYGPQPTKTPKTATTTPPARPTQPPPTPDAATTAPTSSGRRENGRLVVIEGSLAGTSLPLSNAAVTVGRAAGSTLVLDDDYASSQHARLVPRDGIWLIEDLGSTNGTYLDGERITEPTPVPAGARIRVGQTSLELQQ